MAAEIEISTDLDNRIFVPGEQLKGRVRWANAEGDKNVEIRLFHYTQGKGNRDVQVIADEVVEQPGPSGERDFFFQIPDRVPPSFSGKLVSLQWAVECQIKGRHGTTELLEIVVSPTGEELNLYKYADENLPDYSDGNFGGKMSKWRKTSS